MTKKDMVGKVAEVVGLSKKDAEAAVNAYEDALIADIKAGGQYKIAGFGTFSKVQRAARKGRNPQTGAEITIPASVAVKFKTSKKFSE